MLDEIAEKKNINVDDLGKHDENYIKENYMGVIVYVTLRINLVKA